MSIPDIWWHNSSINLLINGQEIAGDKQQPIWVCEEQITNQLFFHGCRTGFVIGRKTDRIYILIYTALLTLSNGTFVTKLGKLQWNHNKHQNWLENNNIETAAGNHLKPEGVQRGARSCLACAQNLCAGGGTKTPWFCTMEARGSSKELKSRNRDLCMGWCSTGASGIGYINKHNFHQLPWGFNTSA